jgi:hypothetical protein
VGGPSVPVWSGRAKRLKLTCLPLLGFVAWSELSGVPAGLLIYLPLLKTCTILNVSILLVVWCLGYSGYYEFIYLTLVTFW